ncbi:MAG: methylmalonyl-CoA decarboxylase [Ignavibacteria bacterium]|nr:methylmalonyl-CoA decarboxylase [Ignavibacteria bacterium]
MANKYDFIIAELRDKIGTIIFNNPSKLNALTSAMLLEIIEALLEFKEEKARVVIIRSAKWSKVWSSGHDINELPLDGIDPLGQEKPLEKALSAIQTYPAPVIAMIEGSVWGGACDLTITCDLAIGTPECSFAITPAKIGVPYNASGILHFINRLGLSHAKEMFFTGTPVDAETALHFGIINHIVDSTDVETFTYDLASKISKNSPLSIEVIKEQFRILTNAHPITPNAFEHIESLRRKVYCSEDYKEGINSFKEKRKPDYKGK